MARFPHISGASGRLPSLTWSDVALTLAIDYSKSPDSGCERTFRSATLTYHHVTQHLGSRKMVIPLSSRKSQLHGHYILVMSLLSSGSSTITHEVKKTLESASDRDSCIIIDHPHESSFRMSLSATIQQSLDCDYLH